VITTDLKQASRVLAQKPGFSAVVVLTLALGIGASTAIFSVLDAVLLRPLPYPQQERIVELEELTRTGRGMPFAEPNYVDIKTRSRSFDALAQYAFGAEGVAGGKEPVRANVAVVSAEFPDVLRVRLQLGRWFGPNESAAVVSFEYWQRLLGGRTNLEGTVLRFANGSFPVVGVLPPDAAFPPEVEIWSPREIHPPDNSRTAHNWRVIGRLKENVSVDEARVELSGIARQLQAEHGRDTDAADFGIGPLRERLVKDVRGTLLVLCGAVALLLVIACSNVANLLLVRTSTRRTEVALRTALGASRWQLARQFITEAVVLTATAAAAGVLLAIWSVHVIVSLYGSSLPAAGRIGVNANVLLFTVGMSLLVAIVLGVVPLLYTSRERLRSGLHEGGRGNVGTRVGGRLRSALIVAQVALTVLLLVGAGLLGRSFQQLLTVHPGFETENAVAMRVLLPFSADRAEQRRIADFHQQLLERLDALPGVLNVGGTNALPMSGSGATGTFMIQDGRPVARSVAELSQQLNAARGNGRTGGADYRVASSDYFAAMNIPLLRGRTFAHFDRPDGPHVAIVSESLARQFFNGDPIGQQLQFGNIDGDLRLLTVIGVVGDVRHDGLHTDARPAIYVHLAQRPAAAADFSIVLRARGESMTLIEAMRREVRALNPEAPTEFQRLEQVVCDSLDGRRFSMGVLGAFAGAALLLAMVGLYGVMAFSTAERTAEIGMRMVLGAKRTDMLRLVLRQSFTLVLLGVGIGTVAALAGTRVIASLLYGVAATDAVTFAGVVGLLTLCALIASYIPARRAMNVDPIVALRHE
jgi:putative ABC transport system permease protein